MKKIKIIIPILIIIILIICIILAMIFIKQKNEEELDKPDLPFDDSEYIIPQEYNSEIKNVTMRSNYYIAKGCVEKYYSYYTNMFAQTRENGYTEEMQTRAKEEMYNLLDTTYINENGITKDNINTKLSQINESVVNVTKIYVSEQSEDMATYIVVGTLRNKVNSNISYFTVMVRIDDSNSTFAILPSEYVNEKFKDLRLGDKLNSLDTENIKRNNDNTYEFKYVTDEQYAQDLMGQYKEEALYNAEMVYNKLDSEYKEKRFASLEEFKDYEKRNFRNNFVIRAISYKKIEEDGYTRYVCMDQNNNYYIFNEKNIMDYTLILDTYTIDLPEFIDKYNNATEEDKAKMNLEKIQEAINNKDYRYVYRKLNETFRNNNFQNIEMFENYMNTNFFDNNKMTYTNLEKQGDAWLFESKIKNANGIEEKGINVVIKINEGTDFEMSFSIK